MDFITDSEQIAGVQLVNLRAFADERGVFQEVFRREWFPQVNWDRLQSNCSHSKAHVLRGLHYHFKQVDYWYVPHGTIRAGLADLRPQSPTYQQTQVIEMGGDHNIGLFIPIGVAHGFYGVTDCTLIYYVNNYYDNQDEYGVAWDDTTLDVAWGVAEPTLSGRDRQNPTFAHIPDDARPI
jgi:dTDP-4-dehydrorhamnose 3,5-epimerase